MAVMDIAVLGALRRHTAQIKYAYYIKKEGFKKVLLQIGISMFYCSNKQTFSPK